MITTALLTEVGADELQQNRPVLVQDEPALEIAMPQVFDQPVLTSLQRGKVPQVEGLVAKIYRKHRADPGTALGPDYQALVTEFQPLFAWAMASWDFLLTTAGCRFVPRAGEHKYGVRGDYRVVTDKDFSRLVHAVFRRCVFEFAQNPVLPNLSQWLREQLWPRVAEAYRKLEQPADPRQRTLTPYSYLRCVPYGFLNDYHDELVYATTGQLPEDQRRAVEVYFFHFHTEAASAEALARPVEDTLALLRQALTKLLIHDRLVYCLLRQIERY